MSFEEIAQCPENFMSGRHISQGFPSYSNTIFLTVLTNIGRKRLQEKGNRQLPTGRREQEKKRKTGRLVIIEYGLKLQTRM